MSGGQKAYGGIDGFRALAALLVVAIHTSPLLSLRPEADFLLTHVLARVAVPFFFMTTGFFLFAGGAADARKLKRFAARTALLYGVALLLYLPVNLYNGHFGAGTTFAAVLREVAFTGTFYHLWYLPASLLGAALVWLLLRYGGKRCALAVALALYALGLLGDSYYGLTEGVPALRAAYTALFTLTETRNGLFFAPLFLVLGAVVPRMRPRIAAAGLSVSLALLLCEGWWLRGSGRHDSQYIALVPCLLFLFPLLLEWKPRVPVWLRDASLFVYIAHPLVIVLVRGFAKWAGATAWLVEQSAIHFLLVACLSFGAAYGFARVRHRLRAQRGCARALPDRAWLEIDMDNLRHNAQALRETLPAGCRFMAVVKDNAYGHGALRVSRCLNRIGVRAFAVSTLGEGVELRKGGVRGEILVLGYTDIAQANVLRRYRLSQSVISGAYAEQLSLSGFRVRAHLAIDTGMHRLGIDARDVDTVARCLALSNIDYRGIYTHLCAADGRSEADVDYTRGQVQAFRALLEALKLRGCPLPPVHAQSSYGLLNYPELRCDYVRVGIALYGVLSRPMEETVLRPEIRPVLSLRSQVALLHDIAPGESVGYGRRFTAEVPMRIAVVPIGYGDGIPRSLSCGGGSVLIRGQRAPIVGLICMDQLMVDVSAVPGVVPGERVTLIGSDSGAVLSAEELSARAQSITNELLSRLGGRLLRISV